MSLRSDRTTAAGIASRPLRETLPGGGEKDGWRIDLGAKPPVAKFVKIGRTGAEKKSLSLVKVLVYGKRLF